MSPKILIFGMHRSGTTLLADIVRKHSEVKHVFHESVLLDMSKEKLFNAKTLPDYKLLQDKGMLLRASNVQRQEVALKFDLASSCWAAKMSYPGPVILQEWQDTTLNYAERWLDYFGDEACIIHIVRHPFDVFLSASARWLKDQRHIANYGEVTLDNICRDWSYALNTLLALQDSEERVLTTRFETLVSAPKNTISQLLEHCKLTTSSNTVDDILKSDVIFFGKVRQDRAFRYRKEEIALQLSRSTERLLIPLFERFGYDL